MFFDSSLHQDATGYVFLLIQPTRKEDAGWYTVSAKNEAGIVSCTARLDIYGKFNTTFNSFLLPVTVFIVIVLNDSIVANDCVLSISIYQMHGLQYPEPSLFFAAQWHQHVLLPMKKAPR